MPALDPPDIRPDLDILLDAALKTGGETSGFDFKEQLDLGIGEHRVKLVRAIGAFGNTDRGGHIFIGVSDDRRIVGLPDAIADQYDQTRVQLIVRSYLAPPTAVQVRQHRRDDKRIVVVEVSPFDEIPSIVTTTAKEGREQLQAGTFLFRNGAAESALLTAESDVRRLCDSIATRRANTIGELLQRAGFLNPNREAGPVRFEGLTNARAKADEYWPPPPNGALFVEGAFAAERPLSLSVETLRTIVPYACVPGADAFPFHHPNSQQSYGPARWGLLGAIPYPPNERLAAYLWLLVRDGSFLNRSPFWEDKDMSVIPGGVGLYHVLGNAIMVVRFLDRLGRRLELDPGTAFRIALRLSGVKGRYLANEMNQLPLRTPDRASEPLVEATIERTLAVLRSSREDTVVSLTQEIAWQMGRADLTRNAVMNAVANAGKNLGPEYAFPEVEAVPPADEQ